MKKLLLFTLMLLAAVSCYDDSILRERINVLEQAMYQSQIDALNQSIRSLEELETEIRAAITDLEQKDASLEGADADIRTQITSLKQADSEINSRLTSLQELVATKIANTEAWVTITFATIEQYNELVQDLSDLSSLVGSNYESLQSSIASTSSEIKSWVEASLANYATKNDLQEASSKLESGLTALSDKLSALDSRVNALENQVSAINSTIVSLQEMDILINQTIEQLKTADTNAQSQIDALVAYDETLKTSIESLQSLHESSINETKDWVTITFSTLEQYNTLVGNLSALNDLLTTEITNLETSLEENYTALSAEIVSVKSTIESWVESTLENYATNSDLQDMEAKLKSELEALDSRLTGLGDKVAELEAILSSLTKQFSIEFSDVELGLNPGGRATIEYTLAEAKSGSMVKIMCNNGWRAKVIPSDYAHGTITVTAPDPMVEDEIIVLAYDGDQKTIMRTINFVTGVISASVSANIVGTEGGTFTVDVTTNMNYEVSIPAEAQNWLSLVQTRAMRTDVLHLTVRPMN